MQAHLEHITYGDGLCADTLKNQVFFHCVCTVQCVWKCFSWAVRAKLFPISDIRGSTRSVRLCHFQTSADKNITAGWGWSCRFLGDSWLTPRGQWYEATTCFIHNKELQVCVCVTERIRLTVYPPLQHESSSLSKYIPHLKQGEGRYWQAKMQEATVLRHCP